MSYRAQVQVRFHEVDQAGIAFYSRAFEYAHTGFEEALAAAGISSVMQDEGWAMPLVHADSDFVKPMKRGDALTIEVSLERLGRTSCTMQMRILGDQDDLRATVRQVHCFVRIPAFEPRPAPPTFVRALRALGLLVPETTES